MKSAGIILAAGNSTRFKSKLSKVFYPLLGKPIYKHVTDSIAGLVDDIYIVTNPNQSFEPYKTIIQAQQLGTGDAIRVAHENLPKDIDTVLVVCGDTPCLKPETLKELFRHDFAIAVFNTKDIKNPYGRFSNNKIVEYKEATDQERQNPCCYAGVMVIKRNILAQLLPHLPSCHANKECYITDLISLYEGAIGVVHGTEEEFAGINTKVDLAECIEYLNKRWIEQHMLSGAVFLNPQRARVSHDTIIEQDVVISEDVCIGPNVVIEEGAVIHPFVCLENCIIRKNAQIGPFAHIRGKSDIGEFSQIGNFVEVKNVVMDKGAKAKHLSYLGDATIGEKVNMGAGSIICNYDGKHKHHTTIKNNAMIGSNVCLIAPITVGAYSFIGAGSTVSKDVEDDILVVERAPEKRKKLR